MKHYATATGVGVWETFLTLAAIYFVFMICGALGYRVPREDWRPAGWTAPPESARHGLITRHDVHLNVASLTPQFWLLWAVLCLNVTAGIGIIAVASPLLQEVFGGKLIGIDAGFAELSQEQLAQIAAIAAGFTGLLSLFNIAGRIFWASLSDRIGRKVTYAIFFLLGLALYSSIPWTASSGNLALFVAFCCVILTMYGGGFATVPAYLADMFGTKMVGAIHGRLLTAWSVAGIFGPVLITVIREYQLAHGVPRAQAYSITMYILAGLLALGLICNWLVRPVNPKHHMKAEELGASPAVTAAPAAAVTSEAAVAINPAVVVLAWLAVWIPIGWGVWVTLEKAVLLFR
jgi:MFS family permease